MMRTRLLTISACVLAIGLVAAEARRGFNSGGSGPGAYDSAASTTSWDLSSTPDADCQAEYGQSCADLTQAQLEEVTQKTDEARAAGYANYSDYATANSLGYTQTPDDGALWVSAKNANAALEADCNGVNSTDCEAIAKANFITITNGHSDAITAGYGSYNDWLTAQGKGYSQNPTDAAIWLEATGNALQAACQAELPSALNCNELTKALYAQAQAGNALLVTKIDKIQDGALTSTDLSELGLDLSSNSTLGNNPAAWQIDYLETVLATTTGTTKSSWQSTIDAYSSSAASAWYLSQIAQSSDSSGTYASANATYELFHEANVDSGLSTAAAACSTGGTISSGKTCAMLGVTNAQIAANIRTSGFTSSPNATDMRNFLTEARGFTSGTTYADIVEAIDNGWSVTDRITASNSGGWTSSSADHSTFAACKTSADAASGGAGICTIALAQWTSLNALTQATDADDITTDDLENIINAAGAANADNIFGDLAALTTVEADYIKNCIGATLTSSQVNSCVSNATAATISRYEIGEIVTGSTGYNASAITENLLTNAGALSDSDNLAIATGNFCGVNANSSCLSVIQNGIASASLSSPPTALEIDDWIKLVVTADLTAQADNFSVTNPPSGQACAPAAISIALPGACNHPSWTCTSSTPDITLSDADGNGHNETGSYDASVNGITGDLSYTIRRTLTFYGGSSYYKDHDYMLNLAAASNSAYSWQAVTQNSTEAACNACPSGYRLATKSEAQAAGYAPDCGWASNELPTSSSGMQDHCKLPSLDDVTSVYASLSTCGSYKCWGGRGCSHIGSIRRFNSSASGHGYYIGNTGGKYYYFNIDHAHGSRSYYCVTKQATCP